MRFLFNYATKGRPDWCLKTLATYYKMLSGKHEYQFIVTVDDDDILMTSQTILAKLAQFPDLVVYSDMHNTKVDAINDDVPDTGWDIMAVVSDDMIPVLDGFDDIIAQDMEKHFPNLDGTLHYNDDLYGKNVTITFSILGKALYDDLGYVYHPDYASIFCDNEFTEVVKSRGQYIYIDRIIVKHDWKGFSDPDETHQINDKKGSHDGTTYRRRFAAGFPKESIYKL